MELGGRLPHQWPDSQACSGDRGSKIRFETKALIEVEKTLFSCLSVAGHSIAIETAHHPLHKPCGMAAMLMLRVDGKNAKEHVVSGNMLLAKLIIVLADKGHARNSVVAYSALETHSASANLPP